MSSAKAREAFELEREPDKMRDRYGRNRFGQSCLLARRLIEAGVRLRHGQHVRDRVRRNHLGHSRLAAFSPISCYRDLVGPMFDNAFSSLLEDLHSAACWRIRW